MGTQIYLRQIPIASFEAAVLDLPQITNGITQLVSQNTGTAVSNGYNYNPVIALGDVAGSLVYVAWDSEATDLVASDTNGARDVFFRSVNRGTLALGGTVLVSKANGTVQGGNSDSSKPVLSEDAEYVAFVSAATNLLAPVPAPPDPPEDLNGKNDIYLRGALLSGPDSMERISEGGLGQANEDSYPAGLSADGRYVLFTSEASNLVEGDTNNVADIFMMDTATWTLSRASLTVFSGEPTEQSGATSLYDAGGADISGDGKSIVFQSSAQILPGVSLFEGRQIYRRKY
jgi:Tol biopolymer transport system component